MKGQRAKGTFKITKLILRQDRFKIIIWLAGILFTTLATALAYPPLYKTDEDVQAIALTLQNPAMEAMLGPGYPPEDYNTAVIFGHEMLLFTVVAVAVMNILMVGKTMRQDEEEGRIELVRSLPVGRLAYLNAAALEVFLVNGLLALLTGFGLGALDISGMDWESSFLYGCVLGAFGLAFASVTALFAQLMETARAATMFSFAFLIVAYIIRAAGDVSNETVSMISPLGWAVRTEVFYSNDWRPVFFALIFTAAAGVLAFYLNNIRDMGTGFLPERKGRSRASRFLQTLPGFVVRLERTQIVSWGIGVFLLGASYGSIVNDLESYLQELDYLQDFLNADSGNSLLEQFLGLVLAILSLIGSVPTLIVLFKLKSEEQKNRMEHFYSRPVSRYRMMAAFFGTAVGVSVLMQAMAALGLWSALYATMEEPLAAVDLFRSAFVYLPALWALAGAAVLIIGFFPKAANLLWLYLVYCFFVLYLKDLLDLPEWLTRLSVFEHIPDTLKENIDWLSLTVLTAIAAVAAAAGMIGYRRRDLAG